jgi:hypothetical protein
MSILKQKSKRRFNVNDTKDLETFANFVKKSTWGSQGCPFEVEDPYLSVPDMIKDKIARKHLGIK